MLQMQRRIEDFEIDPTPIGERIRRMLLWRGGGAEQLVWIPFLVRLHIALKRATDPEDQSQSQQGQRDEESEVSKLGALPEQPEELYRETHSPAQHSAEQRRCDVQAKLQYIGLKDRELAVLSRLRDGWSMRETGWLCGLSSTQVFRLNKSALQKIQAAGLTIEEFAAPDTEYVDPAALDRRAAR